jgi:hypothetical protein
VCHVSLPSSYRSRRGHIHLLQVLPLVGCRSKTPTGAETFPEFTSPVGMKLTDKEEINKIEKSPLNPNQPNTQSMPRRKIKLHLRKTNHYPRHQPINQWPLHLPHGSKCYKLSPRGNSVFMLLFCTAYLD